MTAGQKSNNKEKTSLKGTGLCGFGDNSNVAAVDSKSGKILRIRPLHYDWKFKPEEFKPWQLEARAKVFKSPLKTLIPPHAIGYKKRIYSPNRILYPLKRVDWDQNGERNPQNRGISGYVRISWDEATDMIAGEIRRVIKKYGPEAILAHELGIPYAAISLCTYYDTWRTDIEPATREEKQEVINNNSDKIKDLVLEVISRL